LFTLTFSDGQSQRSHRLREGETVIGRAPSCDLIIAAALISRQHAHVRVEGGHVFLRDAGSTHGTTFKGARLKTEQEIVPGDTFLVGPVEVTLEQDVKEDEVLSEHHQLFEESATIFRRLDQLEGPFLKPLISAEGKGGTQTAPEAAPSDAARLGAVVERRSGQDRRRGDLGRPSGDRRSGRDRRGGRVLRLLTEISKTLVTVQPIEQVLSRVVELVFEVLPAERAFLLLRDAIDQPLSARVMRHRDGSIPSHATISRTIVNMVMGDRVAMLAKDALYDTRLDASTSIQRMNIRSFMCAPLWNRNEVIGVLYCDNPRSKKFTSNDLEVFAALCNYAAVAIEQARLSARLLEETRRRERLQRYHSPGVVNRILQGQEADNAFVTQERDVSVMFCDIVGFTTMCQHAAPQTIGDMLNEFFGRMGEVIFEHDGTLDKFIGDAILAVFGAPFEQADHATRAVAAALAMRRELTRVNADHPERPIRMRIAINSGRALTGDIGSPKRREFTVLGDVVNTAARIESSVAQPDQIVISQHTRSLVGDGFKVSSLGGFTLRGRDAEIEVFEVLG
jgi:adenylate cyclase